MKYEIAVSSSDHNKKLMDVLSGTAGMSRLLIKRIRIYGKVTVNGAHHRMIDPVSADDRIVLEYNESPENSPLIVRDRANIRVLYSDQYLIVMDKPAGMVTHHTSHHQSGTLMDQFSDLRLHPVSRLDRETSGLILMARDPHVHHRLSLQHRSQCITKIYTAVNHGIFPFSEGRIVAPIKRAPGSIMLRIVSNDGSCAQTTFRQIQAFPKTSVSINEFQIHTGRTHQIRVHSLFCGCPVIGDGLYGPCSNENHHEQRSMHLDSLIGRQALHASLIAFNHPITHDRLEFTCELPSDIVNLIDTIRSQESF